MTQLIDRPSHAPAGQRYPAVSVAGRARRWAARGGLAAVVFILPTIIVFAVFSWYPITRGVVMSVQRTNLVDAAQWVGWENFRYVLSDPLLPKAVANTGYFALLALIFGFPVPLFLAVFMGELRRGRALYSVLTYLPVVVPPVVAILLWKVLYAPHDTGLFNVVLGWFGIQPLAWLNSSSLAMPAIVLESTWANAGSTAIIYLAALTGTRSDLYEAAELDGASIPRRVWHVTLPQIRGIILIMLMLQLIGTSQVFMEPFLFTGGGPNNATVSVLLMIYNYAFINGDYGAATALSVLLSGFLVILAALYQLATRRWSAND